MKQEQNPIAIPWQKSPKKMKSINFKKNVDFQNSLMITPKPITFSYNTKHIDYIKEMKKVAIKKDKKISPMKFSKDILKQKKLLDRLGFNSHNKDLFEPDFYKKGKKNMSFNTSKMEVLGSLINDNKKFKKFSTDSSVVKFKMLQKSLQKKMKSFKSNSSKKILKSMENKIQKISLKLKESQKSVLELKKSVKKSNKPKEDGVLFAEFNARKQKQLLEELKKVLTALEGQKYSSQNFKISLSNFETFTKGLTEIVKYETSKLFKISFSKMLKNLKTLYCTQEQSIPLGKCFSEKLVF